MGGSKSVPPHLRTTREARVSGAFEPQRCESCGITGSFALKHNFCGFGNKQFVKLQETPESIPAGETPQTIQLYCCAIALIDPGCHLGDASLNGGGPVGP